MSGPWPQGDPFVRYDAAYVLGALSTQERADYERHLDECPDCARAVRELAGMPGLLGRADPAPESPAPPPDVLPGLSVRARRTRRRRVAATVASAAVAVAACVALLFAVLLLSGDDFDGTPMRVLGDYPVTASVAVTDTTTGSVIEMSCAYQGQRGWDYVLVVIPADGDANRVARWHALPGDPVHLRLATRFDAGTIDALEIRTTTGVPVLRLDRGG